MIEHDRLYEERFRDTDQARRQLVWDEIAPFIQNQLGNPERVLDLAAGRGEFINAVEASERWAVDMTEHQSGELEENVNLVVSDILTAELPESFFDAVWISNFLEHLSSPEDVAKVLAICMACLKPGGRVGIMGPNFRYTYREYYDYADHTLALTERAVVEHLNLAGFTPIEVVARFLPYSFNGRLPSHPLGVRAYLKLKPAWRLLGKQFLLISEAPGP